MITPKEEAILKTIGEYSVVRQEVIVSAFEILLHSYDCLIIALDLASATHKGVMSVAYELVEEAELMRKQFEEYTKRQYEISMN